MWFRRIIAYNIEEGFMYYVYEDFDGKIWNNPPFLDNKGFHLKVYSDVEGKEIKKDFIPSTAILEG